MAQRIVSLAPSITETLYALGAGDEVVGVTSWCDWPSEAKGKPKVGGFIGIDARKVLDLKPDLVLASSSGLADQGAKLAAIRDAGVEVHADRPRDLAGVLEHFLRVGILVGRPKETSALIERTRAAFEGIMDQVPAEPRPRVYYEEWGDPLMSVSEGIWIHDMIEAAGGANVFAGAGAEEPLVGADEVVAKDPEVIVVGWCGALGRKPTIEDVVARPGWSTTSAARAGRVHVVDDTFFTRPGPRLPEGLAQLAGLLHPKG
ncbi:MAG TPA: cobalamin-binding protein [Candidatus Thermoplasmatota archaeon]|jgi:iron complex transport system substrate-binding protein|nr:cobalamin-binding protein [Candidatus Thermoplasmatota archaeon]